MMPEYYRDELEALTESEFYEQSGVFEHSIVVPLRFMQYLSGVRLNGIPRADSGFLFRRTDIETIRLYVDHARLLPTVLENVKRLYPPAAVGLEGLEPEKVVGFHQQVLAHAHTWTHLEHAVKVACDSMNQLAGDILERLQRLIEDIDGVMGERPSGNGLGITDLPRAVLTDEQRSALELIRLNRVHEQPDIRGFFNTSIFSQCRLFNSTLANVLVPHASALLDVYSQVDNVTANASLKTDLRALDDQLHSVVTEYERLITETVPGRVPQFSLEATSGVFSRQAGILRGEIHRLVVERGRLVFASLPPDTLGAFLYVTQQRFSELRGRFMAAAVTCRDMENAWEPLQWYVMGVNEYLKQVSTLADLNQLKTNLERLMRTWLRVKALTAQVYSSFTQILERDDWAAR